jgi:drug/metabolite transporter (DMT)-like permease
MNPQVIGLFLFAILSGTMMGISQKFLAGYSPLLVNAVAQAVASMIFFVLYMVVKGTGSGFQVHRAMIVLALAFVGLNYGYSALYSHGVMLAYVPIIVTGGMTVLLGLAGWLWFGEQISLQFIIGALIILVGMGVMVIRL